MGLVMEEKDGNGGEWEGRNGGRSAMDERRRGIKWKLDRYWQVALIKVSLGKDSQGRKLMGQVGMGDDRKVRDGTEIMEGR